MQKSKIYIFRFEDVIFSIYPHLAALRRRGTSTREVFSQVDPEEKKKQQAQLNSGFTTGPNNSEFAPPAIKSSNEAFDP